MENNINLCEEGHIFCSKCFITYKLYYNDENEIKKENCTLCAIEEKQHNKRKIFEMFNGFANSTKFKRIKKTYDKNKEMSEVFNKLIEITDDINEELYDEKVDILESKKIISNSISLLEKHIENKKKMKKIFYFDINGTITTHDYTEKISKDYIINKKILKTIISNDGGTVLKQTKKENKNYKDIIENIHKNEYKNDKTFQELRKKVEEAMKHKIFPSFLKFLDKHPDDQIIFRTFGRDGPDIINDLKKLGYEERFKSIRFAKIKVNEEGIPILYMNEGKFKTDDITGFIEMSGFDLVIQDDFDYWNKNGRKPEFGKFAMSGDYEYYFFDDMNCIRYDEKRHVILVSTIGAMLDEDYFNVSEFNYSSL